MATIRATLSWTDNAGNESGFKVERSVSGGAFAPLTTVPPNTTSYVDDGLALGTAYSYRVIATNALGDSAPSNQVDVTTPNVPPVPSGLQVIVTIVP